MREILFRGKRRDNGEWIEGYYCRAFRWTGDKNPVPAIQEADCYSFREIIPETVGQYTGLTDKNGKKIFEGDILVRGNVVEYCDDSYCINGDVPLSYWAKRNCVVGNIHDNPELLRF